jgi:tetratricopeptide (TPR) repeat protein
MRNLGKYYFYEKEYKTSIECFEKALGVNKLYPDTWFTLGCAYMRLEDYKGASFAFGSCLSIDDRL